MESCSRSGTYYEIRCISFWPSFFRRNYPTFKLFASIADNSDPQMYHMLMNTLEAVFEQAPYPELASLRFDLAMYYHSTGIKVTRDIII